MTAKQQAQEERISVSAIYMRRYRIKHGTKHNAYMSEFRFRRRRTVINHYGGKCECCGETEFGFLSIDHINGGGTKHRLIHGVRGNSVIEWIIKNNFPSILRVLCHNCNQAIGFYGKCPHEAVRTKAA